MLLSQYVSLTRSLIQTPPSPNPIISDALLRQYVNLARAQTAIDAECVRGSGDTTIGAGVVVISITAVVPQLSGVSQAIVVRNARLGGRRVDIRPWDWFENYYLNGPPNPPVIPRSVMAHQGQGAFSTLYVYSAGGGNLLADLVLLPVDLVDDTTADAVPFPWTDAVPFWAGFYAYMALQRQGDADIFHARYTELMRRGRTEVTSSTLPENDPGGIGAVIATTKTTLGAPSPAVAQAATARRAGA